MIKILLQGEVRRDSSFPVCYMYAGYPEREISLHTERKAVTCAISYYVLFVRSNPHMSNHLKSDFVVNGDAYSALNPVLIKF